MILGVAIKQGDLVICLPKPNRHADCIKYALEVLGLTCGPIAAPALHQGFYTENGKYLNRGDAFIHAKKYGQLINHKANCYLFSKDVW